MSRLESIKEKFTQKGHVNHGYDYENEDVEQLLQLVERYETALKEVTVSTSHNHALYVADNALKEGNHE